MSDRVTSSPWGAGTILIAIGLVFVAIHGVHFLQEIMESPQAAFAGTVIPMIVSALLILSGYWVIRRDWRDISPWRVVSWAVAGSLVALVLVGLLVWYQTEEGGAISHLGFVLAMFATYGAAIGLIISRYDLHIQTARAELMRRTRRLDQFASIVSHDLRNPLNVAAGYVDHAKDTGDLSVLSNVEDAHERIDTILSDMLALARNNTSTLAPTPVDLETVAHESWSMVETNDATIDVHTDKQILADASRLKTLFENLFRNAIEHNDGAVRVRVGSLDTGFFVEDDGTGIPMANRDRVFETGFTTGGGSGLGLPIVQAAAEAHDWSFALTESETGGARFEFTDIPAPSP